MADREDFATAVGALIKGRSPVGHTHNAIQNTLGRVSVDSAGGVQHAVNSARVWWVNDQGRLVQGTVPWAAIDGVPTELRNGGGWFLLTDTGMLQYRNPSGDLVWQVTASGTLSNGYVPWARLQQVPTSFPPAPHTHDDRYAPLSMTVAGTKTVPLALTTGQSQFQDALTGSVRIPVRFNAPISRYRLHIRPWNPRLGQVTTAAVDFTGMWLAQTPQQAPGTSYGQITGTPTQLYQGFTLPAGGAEWVSDWWDATIDGDQQRLLCFGYTTTAAPWGNLGGSWQTDNPADAIDPAASVTRSITIPFDMWLEAETPAGTPVIAGIGDSLTSGWGADYPVYESWLSQYTRRVGALPIHHSHSGDSMDGFRTVNPGKVTRWAGLARADAVVWGLGSNDISSVRTVAQMQADFAALLPTVEASIGPVRFVSTVQPRQMWDASTEAKRAEWNAWVTKRPGVRDVLDFASVVSADGDTLRPEYDSGDGTHLNTAGYLAEADSITMPLASPAPRTDAAALATYLTARGA